MRFRIRSGCGGVDRSFLVAGSFGEARWFASVGKGVPPPGTAHPPPARYRVPSCLYVHVAANGKSSLIYPFAGRRHPLPDRRRYLSGNILRSLGGSLLSQWLTVVRAHCAGQMSAVRSFLESFLVPGGLCANARAYPACSFTSASRLMSAADALRERTSFHCAISFPPRYRRLPGRG